jgi:hypothetical protein
MTDPQPTAPDADASGTEPEEESGAGYGNHAPDVYEEPAEADKDAR